MRGSWIGFVSLCLIPTPILFAQEEIVVTTPAGALHEMVLVPAGEFAMGSEEGNPDALPVHTVYLDSYYLDRYEVTNAQYQGFVTATRRTQSRFTDDSNFNDPRQPVAGVTWSDAGDYCEWAGLRLPTEAEWEKAARGVDGLTYPWGNGSPDGTHANFADVNSEFAWRDSSTDDGYSFTAPVGSYPAGASPYGVYDLAGNLWEWLADWYGENYYAISPGSNPQGPEEGSLRIFRGGSWYHGPLALPSAFRNRHDPGHGAFYIGFRCALSARDKPPSAIVPLNWGQVKAGSQ